MACGAVLGAVAGATWPGHLPAAVVAAGGAVVAVGQPRTAVAAGGLVALLALAVYGLAAARMEATRVAAVTTPQSVAMDAVVVRVPSRATQGWSYVVQAPVGIAGVPAGTRVLVAQPRGDPPAPGAVVRLAGQLRPAIRPGDPAWWRRYLARLRVAGRLTDPAPVTVGHRVGWRGIRDQVAGSLRAAIDGRARGDTAAVVSGVVLGFDERLSTARRDAFRTAGTAHLLAVSGQNVALVGLAVLGTLLTLGAARPTGLACAALAVLGYALLCPPGASVVRAAVTGLLVLGAQWAGRRRAGLYPVLITFTAMVAWEPRSLGDPGLVLSFSAVVGILLITGPLERRLAPWTGRPVALAIAVSAAATLATAPASLALFGHVSLAGLVVNLVAVPLAGIVLLCGLTGAAVGALLPVAGGPALMVAAGGADLLVRLSDLAARAPYAAVGPQGAAVAAGAVAALWAAAAAVRSVHAARRCPAARVRHLR